MLATYSSLRVYSDDHDRDFYPDSGNTGVFDDGTPTNNEGWYILVTGAVPNTPVVSVDWYLTGEFLPNNTITPLTNLDRASPGASTEMFIQTIMKKCPRIASMSIAETERLKDIVKSSSCRFDQLMHSISTHLQTIG